MTYTELLAYCEHAICANDGSVQSLHDVTRMLNLHPAHNRGIIAEKVASFMAEYIEAAQRPAAAPKVH